MSDAQTDEAAQAADKALANAEARQEAARAALQASHSAAPATIKAPSAKAPIVAGVDTSAKAATLKVPQKKRYVWQRIRAEREQK